MLKLNASYSKKVPVPGQDYSSQNYHCSLEVELPTGMTAEQLQTKIHETFALARESVESEIDGIGESASVIDTASPQAPRQFPARSSNGKNTGNRSVDGPASNKQIGFLTDLLKKGGYDISATCNNYGVQSLYDLSRKQCSQIIDDLQRQKAA